MILVLFGFKQDTRHKRTKEELDEDKFLWNQLVKGDEPYRNPRQQKRLEQWITGKFLVDIYACIYCVTLETVNIKMTSAEM